MHNGPRSCRSLFGVFGGVMLSRRTSRIVALLVVLAGAVVAVQAQPPQSATDFTLALVGDAIITRKIAVYAEPAFTRVIDLIRNADAAFVNLEMLFHDYE
ncbi:MAG: hypothetical protein EXQ51_11555, partial [Acidobacteria bacterium]|nr:hypothetical protein [Acidobacteriota bacterium]